MLNLYVIISLYLFLNKIKSDYYINKDFAEIIFACFKNRLFIYKKVPNELIVKILHNYTWQMITFVEV